VIDDADSHPRRVAAEDALDNHPSRPAVRSHGIAEDLDIDQRRARHKAGESKMTNPGYPAPAWSY
jgi:hypothetical protein